MTPKNILFLNGLPDNRQVEVNSIDRNNIMHYLLQGSTNIAQKLNTDQIIPASVVFDTNSKQDINAASNINAIFNEISDADTHIIALAKAQKLYNTFSDKLPFLNIPASVLKTTREQIYTLLRGIDKLHVPKTVRIQPRSASDIYEAIKKEGFEFPVIFRQAGEHNAKNMLIIKDKTEEFYPYALDRRYYYLTQFVESAQNGVYAKFRLVVVDGEVYIRHVLFGDKPIVNHRKFMEKNKKYQKEEEEILTTFDTAIKPKIQTIVKEIYDTLKLDYFGLDCVIDEKFNILLFEANANMDILTNTHKEDTLLASKIQTIKDAVVTMINKRIDASIPPKEKNS